MQNSATCAEMGCPKKKEQKKEKGPLVQKETGGAEAGNRCGGNEKRFSCRGKFIYMHNLHLQNQSWIPQESGKEEMARGIGFKGDFEFRCNKLV